MPIELSYAFVFMLFWAGLTGFIAESKGHGFWDFAAFGFILPVIGLIIVLILPNENKTKETPNISKKIQKENIKREKIYEQNKIHLSSNSINWKRLSPRKYEAGGISKLLSPNDKQIEVLTKDLNKALELGICWQIGITEYAIQNDSLCQGLWCWHFRELLDRIQTRKNGDILFKLIAQKKYGDLFTDMTFQLTDNLDTFKLLDSYFTEAMDYGLIKEVDNELYSASSNVLYIPSDLKVIIVKQKPEVF